MRLGILSTLCMIALGGCQSDHATLTFTPEALKDCGANHNAPVAIGVHWDATEAHLKNGVMVFVSNDPASARKPAFGRAPGTLWIAGGDSGSATTGVWVVPGTTFFVTDAASGNVLASKKVPAAQCT